MPDVHVVPAGDRWTVEINGSKRSTHDTVEEAISQGQHLADEQNAELVVHAEDGCDPARRTRHEQRPARHPR